jgi:branched-chain amino acid transport system substrate-binding protein
MDGGGAGAASKLVDGAAAARLSLGLGRGVRASPPAATAWGEQPVRPFHRGNQGETAMRTTVATGSFPARKWRASAGLAAMALAWAAGPGAAVAQDAPQVKIGFVTFLSGGAAGPFGVPARNAAELVVDGLNAGKVPAPYQTKGIAGAKIASVIIDEAGGPQTQVAEYRKLVQKEQVDLVIGYISSGDCLAIAPVAEELKKLTVFFDCGTPQIFEDAVTSPKYLFRTGPHATMDSVAAARYLLEVKPGIAKIAGINQNYAWGQDSWRDFAAAMQALKPGVQVVSEQFPKLYAGQYGSEISALLTAGADAVHSSFWGGDMEAFIFQGAARGLFGRTQVLLSPGETAMHRLGKQMPDGTILGGRGPHGDFAPKSELNDWFRKEYFDRYATWPTYPSYKMALAILGVKAAYEKAAAGAGGKVPDQEAVIKAFEGLTYDSPSGKVWMALSKGHQAIQDTAYALSKFDKENGRATLDKVKVYKAKCVNPPEGVKSLDWIKGGFKGAECN